MKHFVKICCVEPSQCMTYGDGAKHEGRMGALQMKRRDETRCRYTI